jgi:hypothetical protein
MSCLLELCRVITVPLGVLISICVHYVLNYCHFIYTPIHSTQWGMCEAKICKKGRAVSQYVFRVRVNLVPASRTARQRLIHFRQSGAGNAQMLENALVIHKLLRHHPRYREPGMQCLETSMRMQVTLNNLLNVLKHECNLHGQSSIIKLLSTDFIEFFQISRTQVKRIEALRTKRKTSNKGCKTCVYACARTMSPGITPS